MQNPTSSWTATVRDLYDTSDIHHLRSHNLLSSQLVEIINSSAFLRNSVSSDEDGTMRWSWSTDGQYSTSVAYKKMVHTGVITPCHKMLWKIKSPAKVRTFIWLLVLDRLLTQRNLLVRGWPAMPSCVLCNQQQVEDCCHLFLTCSFTSGIWSLIGLQFNLALRIDLATPLRFWQLNRKRLPSDKRQLWDSIWAATCWTVWKHRCKVIFDGEQTMQHRILLDVELQIINWRAMRLVTAAC
ncbi:Cyst nematode resistance protein-like protein [Rhynchospora pubera]|uniref:Cyst nematode resistance protein-like protein n=1 Tax=Rhynchospora pubera TaxID=906938 RepID=A0AAV8GN12_9POAL|nr:Cyst nematode resistance protein-like protein [Rhynchospora pubera]